MTAVPQELTQPVTVAQLIEVLSGLPGDYEVFYDVDSGYDAFMPVMVDVDEERKRVLIG